MIQTACKAPKGIAGYDPAATAGKAYHYDAEAAERPLEFFSVCLQHVKGEKAGRPLELEPWQQDIVKTLFGWLDFEGRRRYRRAYIEVPRKNGKTTMLAAVALYVLFADGEAGAECYCAASDADQASLLYSIAASMIRRAPALDAACKIRDSVKRIIYGDSFLRAIASDATGSHGFNSHLNCNDELHAWEGARGQEFYDVLQTGTGARAQPLTIDITTAGYDRHSVCWRQHRYASKVRDGAIEDVAFLPVIYGAPEDADWRSEDTWAEANPNLGVSVSLEYLRTECRRAQEEPRYENTFRRLHLNQWTSQETRWLPIDRWRSCIGEDVPIPEGANVWGGLDLASTTDLCAWCICQKSGSGYRLRWRFWIPEERMREVELRDRVPYGQWVREGWVTPTDGASVNYEVIHAAILEDAERYALGAVGYDPWNAEATRAYLETQGVVMVKMRQGMATLSGPSKELERAVLDRTLDHGGNPVAEWMAENVQVQTDTNGNIRPVRPEHGASARKIDGIVAAIMAVGVASVDQPAAPSIYERRGPILV